MGNSREVKRIRRTRTEARQEILDAALSFLTERPFRDFTVAELMNRTSIGRSAFYIYFRDRYELIQVLLDELDRRARAAAEPWLAGEVPPVEGKRASLENLVDFWLERGPVLRAIAEAAPLDDQLERIWRRVLDGIVIEVKSRIELDRKLGWIGELDPLETAHALVHLTLSYLNERLGRRPGIDRGLAVLTLARVWIRTLYGPGAS